VPPLQLKTIPSSSRLDSSKEGEMMSRIIAESRWQKKLPYALYTVCGWHCYPDITAHVQICLQTWYFRITLFSKIVGKIPLNIFPTFAIKYKEQEDTKTIICYWHPSLHLTSGTAYLLIVKYQYVFHTQAIFCHHMGANLCASSSAGSMCNPTLTFKIPKTLCQNLISMAYYTFGLLSK
jgi:hypothetical protein